MGCGEKEVRGQSGVRKNKNGGKDGGEAGGKASGGRWGGEAGLVQE